ncbi:protein kinase domain-containing protein, partial [Thermobifida halotolerans]|uniref:protein kinase domain-containing protein n=1 Tax=Thermobifida halotolerans TaxID=483545 RepID=UPI001F361084
MAVSEPPDPDAPTRRIDAVEPTTRLSPEPGVTRRLTALLRPGATRRLDADPGRTAVLAARARRQGVLGRMAWRILEGPASEVEYRIPAELRERYTVQDYVGAGGEAVVYRAVPAGEGEGGRRIALKLYRAGHDLNRDLLDRLRALGSASPHVPAIHGYGHARTPWGEEIAWEAQEYFALGSLRTLIDQAPLPDERARAIVGAVTDCLCHWQESLHYNHTDVKPENLLIREPDPPVFALTDFGGAVRATMSQVYGGQAVTEAYAAPEIVEGRREAPAAWWSLGVIAHELVTGRRPPHSGNWLTARNTEVDVSAVADEHWRLLVRGLLTPDPKARWGGAQVRRWLRGERPTVARPRHHRPITFEGISHEDPPSLAFDLMDRFDKGAVWLHNRHQELRTWLDREVHDLTFDRAPLEQVRDRPERAHAAISALAAQYVPGLPPRYRGHPVGAEGVLELARGESTQQAVLREAIEFGALESAARHWCDHPQCRSQETRRCQLLELVQHEVPLIMRQVRATVERLSGAPGFTPPAEHDWDSAWAHAAELVLDAEATGRYRWLLRSQSWLPGQRSDAPRARWWNEQRATALRGDRNARGTRAALVATVLLLPGAVQAGAAQRARDRAAARARRRRRWERFTASVEAGWSAARTRASRQWERRRFPGSPPDGADPRAAERAERRRRREARRVQRGMDQVQRAMSAGRRRRV